jgi:hypothetical protein
MTIAEFIRYAGITSKAEETDHNPNMDNDSWAATASHWNVTLKRGPKTMRVPFSQGSAHTAPPTARDVIGSMQSDASGFEAAEGDFHSWASDLGFEWEPECARLSKAKAADYGMDCDAYHRAKKTWTAVDRQTTRLKIFLGEELFVQLMACEPD